MKYRNLHSEHYRPKILQNAKQYKLFTKKKIGTKHNKKIVYDFSESIVQWLRLYADSLSLSEMSFTVLYDPWKANPHRIIRSF